MVVTIRPTNRGWLKPSQAAKYAGVSLKVFRGWMRNALRPVQIRVGERKSKNGKVEPIYRFFIHYDDIDSFMEQHRQTDTVGKIADELVEGL